jgi:phosphopentomutase
VPGYAAALEAFDLRLPQIEAALKPGDMLVITADHGNDPTWRGTDHTRECVPILITGAGFPARSAGRCSTFADIGATVARHLGLAKTPFGQDIIAS